MTIQITNCHVLRTVKLPARDRYPETRIATLIQECSDSDTFNVVCTEECFAALEMTDRDEAVSVALTARQIDTEKGKAWMGLKETHAHDA
jgi:uncharacterized membrane protein